MTLKPWRDVVTPHPDVASGRYQQAQFAANLADVLAGKAEPEYQDAAEFFQRTYITEGMRSLLVAALERVARRAGEPVVQLKTAFGGGKTHTMLALYHLFGGMAPNRLVGVPEILKQAKVETLPKAKLAVLVGTDLDCTKPRKHPALKGKSARTLWGNLAAQLGGLEGYELVEGADKASVAPGADTLVELLDTFGPCIILIDELVAYARNIYGVSGLPAGSFDSNMTFVQALTEAVKRSKASIVVATIPESNIEIGGEGGRAALERLENTFGRLEAVWKPVGALEGFEIVRRRLFGPVQDEAARDEVCRAFSRLYAEGGTDFPQECKDGLYLERLRTAYPVHPDVFDRLYDDWSTLEKFQKTRGVLRLMAAAIHELWVRGDQALLILPGSLPIDAQKVREELTRYLPDGWAAVVDKDVDGERSEPYRIDNENSRLGQNMAARRVARTIFLGSAPSVRDQRVRGIEDVRIRLGVVQPGESIAVFNDALGRLLDRLTHLYGGNRRFWYDLPPNLRRTVEDKASRMDPAEVEAEIERRLLAVADADRRRRERDQDLFRGIHTCPPGSGDVPDEQEARLVVLSPVNGHRAGRDDSPALVAAMDMLEKRGTAARQYRNMVIFLSADQELSENLAQEVRRFLAWKAVVDESDALNLDAHQHRLATESRTRSDETVQVRLHEAYCWLLVPTQEGTSPIRWETTRIAGGNESYPVKAAKKLRSAEQLITRWSPALLRIELDRWLWKEQPHIELKKLWEYLTSYCYLPRLRDADVLLEAIREGIRGRDYFGYATSVGADGRYQGLQYGAAGGTVYLDATSVLVRPEAAQAQQAADQQTQAQASAAPAGTTASTATGNGLVAEQAADSSASAPLPSLPTRFHGTVHVDPTRMGRDASRVAEEVIQHLTSLLGAKVDITLEVHAEVPEGVPDAAVRTVTENCRTLRFQTHGFERE